MQFQLRRNRTPTLEPSIPAITLLDQLNSVRDTARRDLCPEVVVDLSPVEKINSADVGEIVRLHLQLCATDRRLVLENAQKAVAEILEITRLYRLIEVRSPQTV